MNKEELKLETEKLVNDFLGGEIQAFNRLVFLYQTKIYNLALNYVKSTEEAKDLAQDVFVTVYRSLPKLRDRKKFSSWLYQIAINHCRNRYKKLSRRGFFNTQVSLEIFDMGVKHISLYQHFVGILLRSIPTKCFNAKFKKQPLYSNRKRIYNLF